MPQTLLRKLGFPRSARLSPDGRWLAYSENVGNRTEVFIQGYPEPGQRRQVSVDGGSQPVWRRDGKELFFRSGIRMFGVSIDTARGLQWGRPALLFDRRYFSGRNTYDVAADGRFLMIKRAPSDDMAGQLNVIVELARRVARARAGVTVTTHSRTVTGLLRAWSDGDVGGARRAHAARRSGTAPAGPNLHEPRAEGTHAAADGARQRSVRPADRRR